MSATPPPDDQAVDRWLADRHAALVEDLAATLDLAAGLADALLPARHASFVDDLAATLDLDRGLAAILPPPARPASEPRPAPVDDPTVSVSGQSASAVASLLRSLDPDLRLTLRTHATIVFLALSLEVDTLRGQALRVVVTLEVDGDFSRAGSLADQLADDLGRVLGRARAVARGLARARAVALGLTHTLDLARDLAAALAAGRAAARADAIDLAHELGVVRDLARARTRTSAADLAAGLDHAPALDLLHDAGLVRHLDRAVTLDLGRAPNSANDLDPGDARDPALNPAEDLAQARNDFTGADLSGAKLAGIPLTGVRWSYGTRWPAAWRDRIERDSVEVAPGLYEIFGGTTHADAETVPANT